MEGSGNGRQQPLPGQVNAADNAARDTDPAGGARSPSASDVSDAIDMYYTKSPNVALLRGKLGITSGLGDVPEAGRMGSPKRYAAAGGSVAAITENSHDFYALLSNTNQAALINLIIRYHEALLAKGMTAEAQRIASSLIALQGSTLGGAGAEELHGMDLLLKDGLLKFLLRIHPHLPEVPQQVVRFREICYSVEVAMIEGYDTVFSKFLDLLHLSKLTGRMKWREKVQVLNSVSGYAMPGTLTLLMGPPGCGKTTLHRILAGRPLLGKGTTLTGQVRYNGKDVKDVIVERLASYADPGDQHLALLTVRETLLFARNLILTFNQQNYDHELKSLFEEALALGQDPKTELTIDMMGLKRAADRLVGNDFIRTIDSHERHRVTAAEMLAGAHPVYNLDEINDGMDASVTYDILQALRIFARVRGLAVVVSLMQPSPESFACFDRVILLDRGRLVYQGPRQDILPYFAKLGYVKPDGMEIAEFLSDVTMPEGRRYLSEEHMSQGAEPLDLDGFVRAYEASDAYRDVLRVVNSDTVLVQKWTQGSQPLGVEFEDVGGEVVVKSMEPWCPLNADTLDKTAGIAVGDRVTAISGPDGSLDYLTESATSASLAGVLAASGGPVRLQLEHPHQMKELRPLFRQKRVQTFGEEFSLLVRRQLTIMKRNKLMIFSRIFSIGVLSLFSGTIFFQMEDDADNQNMNLRRGVTFISLITMTLGSLSLMPTILAERAVFYKQDAALFYRPSAYLLSHILTNAMFSLTEATVWSVIVYFLSGLSLKDGGWHFFVYWGIICLTVLQASAMVRFIAYFAPNAEGANGIAGLFIGLFVIFAGFLVPRFKIPKYWIWMYYLNPMQWAISALIINEFGSSSYSELCSSAIARLKDAAVIRAKIPFCTKDRLNQSIGHAFLGRGQFLISYNWIAVACGALLGWFAVFNLLAFLCMCKVRHVELPNKRTVPKSQAMKSDASLAIMIEEAEEEKADASDKKTLKRKALLGPASTSLAFTPVTLSWHDLSYDVVVPGVRSTRTLLSYASGWAKPGEALVIIGSPGAGKTLLLNSLAGRRVEVERLSGQILVNGYAKKQNTFARVMGYMGSDPSEYPAYLTVREAVYFNACLRLPRSVSASSRREFVNEVLETLDMKSVEGVLAMSLAQSTATLEKSRRYMLACELAANPSVLFLDEPLVRLDKRSCIHLLDAIKSVAMSGRSVIATMTNPTHREFAVFDNAVVLRKGGETVYFGPVGAEGRSLVSFFEAIPGAPKCSPDLNAARYVLDVIGDGTAEVKAARDYAFEYRVSDLAMSNQAELLSLKRAKGSLGKELTAHGMAAGRLLQLQQVFTKMQKYYYRNTSYSFSRIMSAAMVALLLGSVFWQIKWHDPLGMGARSGFIYVTLILIGIGNAQGIIPQVVAMQPSYRRELLTKQYSSWIYNFSFGFAELQYVAIVTLVFCSISLNMTAISNEDATHFFKFWFVLFQFVFCITCFALCLSLLLPIAQLAAVVIPVIISVWVATAGLVIPFKKIPNIYIWVFWTNPLQYAMDALNSISFFCETNGPLCKDNGRNLACALNPAVCPNCPCHRLNPSNAFVWDTLAFARTLHNSRIPIDILALVGLIILFRFLAALALRYLRHNRAT